ncbi:MULTISPECIES: 4Fe-4S double cluster binding domain-containing protein [unclassified Candidatus Frackibacter]|uniref:4Fe-4S double cluster binding domain-containing protein n=1 Tax=unclassified Candidatus Frackibacter TaxID=2648818 RepID=UPI00079A2752|nr:MULTISPECIES: 4Fe-4S double cluster binding domain-containing protein [unclassified Candidatus Frackibacter]KXS43420.1 MAG: 4Fe-4S ferredoxin [Candidatus Frackibacter sp. T328-2]SDB96973.1 Epoxyqueuosine reductase QueG (queuosine biosynthesis) [Candidatus Frackibacter sp. WG11]SEM28552.1 Epoxyqueuosine reductase QueG (queuosine biosynthesis) [Candidatus Frackibacter sp. WG12]SFL33440.1 Epoxyqueuosine reductase QueG (queuosine biosynthesis) [Candidatus Frackibacter sp. WG13]
MSVTKKRFNELKKLAEELGVDLVSSTSLHEAKDFIAKQGDKNLVQLPYAISIAIHLPEPVVNELSNTENVQNLLTYDYIVYNMVNPTLDRITTRLAQKIQSYGFNALPIPSSHRTDETNLKGIFSHKLAAHLSGLGWIGKSCLLVTPDFGPRLRLGTVLTDLPLPNNEPLRDNCGQCSICVDNCPSKAFTGKSFNINEPREVRYKFQKCEKYRNKIKDKIGCRSCGICVQICPRGR